MRQRLLLIPSFGALVVATACTMPVTSQLPKAETVVRAVRTPAPTGMITGLVRGPAGVVAAGGANVVAPGGGNLLGPAAGNLRLLALEEQAVAAAEVFVADAAGKPIPGLPSVKTDAQGRFKLAGVPAGFTYVVVARVATGAGDAATLKTLAKATTLGTTADLDTASTFVTTTVVNGREDALGEFNAATFQRAIDATAKHLDAGSLPDLADTGAILDWMGALAEEVAELRTAVGELKTALAQVRQRLDDLEAEIKGRASAAPASPTASAVVLTPSIAPSVAPSVAASVAPSVAPSIRPATGYTVLTLAGAGTKGHLDGQGTSAQFGTLRGIGLDGAGNVYVADMGNLRIRKITAAGVVTTLAGSGAAGAANGAGATATFGTPNDVVFDGNGALIVSDGGTNRMRKVLLDGTTSTLAGKQYGTVDGVGEAAKLRVPRGLAFANGLCYLADTAATTGTMLRTLTSDGTVATIRTAESLDGMLDVAADGAGNVYAVQGHRVVRIGADGQLTVVAGGASAGALDGDGIEAQFNAPQGIARDAAGNLYVADTGNHRIRKITPAGAVSTIAGGASGHADGPGEAAMFKGPSDVEYDDVTDKLYVSEGDGARVRVLTR